MKAKVHQLTGAPDEVPYTLTFGEEKTAGTVRFTGAGTGLIDWVVTLPVELKTRLVSETLVLEFGENGSLGRHERRLDAIRQFPLNQAVPLQQIGADDGAAPVRVDDPLAVGIQKAWLTVEASQEDLTVHVDLRNFQLVGDEDRPALQADLTVDARSYGKRQTLGHAGVLFLSAGPRDGLATVSPFAKLAHFGDGYARTPLVRGRQGAPLHASER